MDYVKTRKKVFGTMYRQRLNTIKRLFDQMADNANTKSDEHIVEELLFNIGNLKVAKDAAHGLLEDLEAELRDKTNLEEWKCEEQSPCKTTN
jgi:hypothetical protein